MRRDETRTGANQERASGDEIRVTGNDESI